MTGRLLIGFALGSVGTWASTPEPHELMSRSVKIAETNWSQAPNYSFLRADVKSKHNSDPARNQYEVLMIEGSPYLRLVGEDGQPLSAARAQEQEQKYQREVRKREHESPRERQKRIEKYQEDRTRDHALLTELCQAFDYTVTGEQRIGGREVWVLHGKPKPDYVPRTREAKVLAAMEVTFWVDKKTYQWPRVEAEVQTPVFLYGMIGKVNAGTKFTLEQEPVSSTLWLPKHFTMQVKATALGFINEDSSSEETYTDYRRVGQAATASNGSSSPSAHAAVE